jgi:hypothetical protein
VDNATIFYPSFTTDISGFPIAAWEAYSGRPHFARTDGTVVDPQWQTPVSLVKTPAGESDYNRGDATHLIRLADGTLLVTYDDSRTSELRAVRSLDVYGDAWSDPVTIAPLGGSVTSQRGIAEDVMVDGKPELIYYGNTLYFIRALDTEATQWSAPVQIAPFGNPSGFSRPAMILREGRPIVAYEHQGINLIQASDPQGSKWGEATVIDPAGFGRITMMVINGELMVSYMSGDDYASNPTISWAPLPVDPNAPAVPGIRPPVFSGPTNPPESPVTAAP